MSPIIRINKTNWERLKSFSVPLEDSIDDALEKVLNVAESKGGLVVPPEINTHPQSEDKRQKLVRNNEWDFDNENSLLLQLEQWLNIAGPGVKLLSRKKTMDTWIVERTGGEQVKLFVPINGMNKLFLPRIDYSLVDKESRIIYKDYHDAKTGKIVGWNYYPQLDLKTNDDLEFVKKLVIFLLEENKTLKDRPAAGKREILLSRLKERYKVVPQDLSLADELIRERRSEAYKEQT